MADTTNSTDSNPSSLATLATSSSASTLDTSTSLQLNRNVGKLVDAFGTASGAVVGVINNIASAIASSILGGTTGTNANRLLRSKGTGGITLQPSVVTLDDAGNLTNVNSVTLPLTPNRLVVSAPTNPGVLQVLGSGTTGQFLRSTGPTSLPSYQTFTYTLTDVISGFIPFPANGRVDIIIASPFAFTITNTGTLAQAGTCTAFWQVNLVNQGTANAVSTSYVSHSQSIAVGVGSSLSVVTTSVASCQGMNFTITISRVLF